MSHPREYNPKQHKREIVNLDFLSYDDMIDKPWTEFMSEVLADIAMGKYDPANVYLSVDAYERNSSVFTLTNRALETDAQLLTRLGHTVGNAVIEAEKKAEQERYKAEYAADMAEAKRIADKWRHRKVPYDGPDSV